MSFIFKANGNSMLDVFSFIDENIYYEDIVLRNVRLINEDRDIFLKFKRFNYEVMIEKTYNDGDIVWHIEISNYEKNTVRDIYSPALVFGLRLCGAYTINNVYME